MFFRVFCTRSLDRIINSSARYSIYIEATNQFNLAGIVSVSTVPAFARTDWPRLSFIQACRCVMHASNVILGEIG